MIERMSRQLIKGGRHFQPKDIPVLQRLTMMMMALNVDGNLGQEVMDQVHKPQNALLHQNADWTADRNQSPHHQLD